MYKSHDKWAHGHIYTNNYIQYSISHDYKRHTSFLKNLDSVSNSLGTQTFSNRNNGKSVIIIIITVIIIENQ